MAQRITALLVIVAPTLAAAVDKFYGANHWTLTKGILLSTGLLLVATFIAAYRLQKNIDDLLDGIPRLISKGTSHYDQAIHDGRGHTFGAPTFYHMRIANEPRGVADRKVAEKVAGTVEILYQDRRQACAPKLHRWEHSLGPAEAGKKADLLESEDIPPNGIEVLLDIAMKYDDEEDFYTPTNDSAKRRYQGFRDPRYQFPPGEYIAHVRLAGANVDTRLECKIVNPGIGKKLILSAC